MADALSFDDLIPTPDKLQAHAADLATQAGLDPAFVQAIGQTESGWKANAKSPKGALGPMQLMPATAAQMGVDPSNPYDNIKGGVAYLKQLSDKFNGDPQLIAAAYNAGPGAVMKAGGVPNYPETQKYVQKVAAAMQPAAPKAQPVSALSFDDLIPSNTPPQADPQNEAKRALMASTGAFGMLQPDVNMGARQVLDAAAQMGARGLESFTSPDSAIGKWARAQRQSTEATNQGALDQYNQNFSPDATPGASVGRAVGQMAATAPLLPAGGAPGLAKSMAQGAQVGAISGALTPDYSGGPDFWQNKAQDVAKNAALGGVTAGVFNAGGRLLSPNSSPAAQTLLDAGVTPTPGQLAGGPLKYIEEKATSIPILGDAIKNAQSRSLDDFNRAIYNRVLAPIGETYKGPVGQDGLAAVQGKLSDAYDNVLAKIPMVQVDQPFGTATLQLQQMAKNLPPAQATQFQNVLQNEVWNRLTPAGTMSGDTMKLMESKLGSMARGYQTSADFDQRQLGQAITQVQANLRDMVARQFPDQAPVLQAVNNGYANLVQLQNAANSTKVARNAGVVTPADYLRGIKKGDNTVRDNAFSSGMARNQDLAQAGDSVLSSKYPDSGTAGRGLVAAGLGALATGGVAGINPMLLAGGGAAMLPYTKMGQATIAALLAKRPDLMNQAGGLLKAGAPYLGAFAPAGLLASP